LIFYSSESKKITGTQKATEKIQEIKEIKAAEAPKTNQVIIL
jgi:hypothetical protein